MASTQKFKAVQKWSADISEEEKKAAASPTISFYSIDSTWMIAMEYQAPNKTNFLFKTGNKTYTLDGSSKNGNSSELSLRRKYA